MTASQDVSTLIGTKPKSTARSGCNIQSVVLAVDARHLARMLCLSVRTVRAMDAGGKLPRPLRLGGRSIRWLVTEIHSWLQAGAPDRVAWEARKGSSE